jgi:glycosyltransferase involved in cell wall biosynthesis
MWRLIFLFVVFVGLYPSEKKIVVIIPSYNNAEFFLNNIDSVIQQKYENYRVLYIDDCSIGGNFDAIFKRLDSKNISFKKWFF